MSPSTKKKAKSVPFQTVTRNRSRALRAEIAPVAVSTVKVELKKLKINELKLSRSRSPSPRKKSSLSPVRSAQNNLQKQGSLDTLPGTKNKSPSPGRKSSTSPRESVQNNLKKQASLDTLPGTKNKSPSPGRKSSTSPKKSVQTYLKKQGNLFLANTQSETSTREIEVIDLSGATSNIVPTNKRKFQATSTAKRKIVFEAANVKVIDDDKRKKARTTQSNVSCSSPGQKNCSDCLERDECIKDLQSEIKKLQENEASIQTRLRIYENFGLAHLEKEEENKSLMKKKLELQEKLMIAEKELMNSFVDEDKELDILIRKEKELERTLAIKSKESKNQALNEEDMLNDLRNHNERMVKEEAELNIQLEAFKKEHAALSEKIPAAKEKYYSRPKELPKEEPIQGPCEICENLKPTVRAFYKECEDGKVQDPIVEQKIADGLTQMFDGALDIAHLTLEIDYLKKRIPNQLWHNTTDYDTRQDARRTDYKHRKEFSEKMCNLMDKHFSTKKYKPIPTSACRMPKFEWEIEEGQRLRANGFDMCCTEFKKLHCLKYFCGRYGDEFSSTIRANVSERSKYAMHKPGSLITEENPKEEENLIGRAPYIDEMICKAINGYPIELLSTIKIK